jgi:hypothetical protein
MLVPRVPASGELARIQGRNRKKGVSVSTENIVGGMFPLLKVLMADRFGCPH